MKLCVERPALWVTVGYMKLCRKKSKMWVRVGYMKLCVDRDLKCW